MIVLAMTGKNRDELITEVKLGPNLKNLTKLVQLKVRVAPQSSLNVH